MGFFKGLMPHLANGEIWRTHKAAIGFGFAVAQVVHDFVFFEQNTKRHHHRSRFQNTEIDDRKVGQVETTQSYFVARLDAFGFQTIGDLVGSAIDLGKAQSSITKNKCSFVGKTAGAVFK